MSPCWASPTLFTYRVQAIPEGLLGVERKALYPQLRRRCHCNVFNSSSPLGDRKERNGLRREVTSEGCPCVCITLPPSRSKGKSAPGGREAGMQPGAAGMMLSPLAPFQLLWDDPNAASRAPGALGPSRCRQLGGPGLSLGVQTSVGPVKSHWTRGQAIGLRRMLPPDAACAAAGRPRCPRSCCAGTQRGWAVLWGCPSSSWAGKSEKSFLASLCLTCGLISGSPWDFWWLFQRHGVSHATHLERGEFHPHGWHWVPKAFAQCSAT